MNKELKMKFEDYDDFNDPLLTKDKKIEFTLIEYLFYDFSTDRSSVYSYVYCCPLDNIKTNVQELLTRYNVSKGEILLKAFDEDFNDWKTYYQVVDDLFTVWYKSFH